MGTLNDTKQATSTQIPFIKLQVLSDTEVTFCIERITLRQSNNPKFPAQWVCKALFDRADAKVVGANENCEGLVAFSSTDSRDGLFEKLQTKTPLHCCGVDKLKLATGNSYYDLVERGTICSCGYDEDADDAMEGADEYDLDDEDDEDDVITPPTKPARNNRNVAAAKPTKQSNKPF